MIGIVKVIVAVMLLLAMPNAVQAGPAVYQIYTAGGQQVSDKALADLIHDYDVIIFGEYHDNAVLHTMEFELLQKAFLAQPKLAVSMEMFERDVQAGLDSYLASQIDEQEFLAKSRPWNNYQEAYRTLVEFAKLNSLPVIAANIPRPLAAQYAKDGSLTGIPADMTGYLPKVHQAMPGEYKRRFFDHMTDQQVSAKMPVRINNLENFYKAQCLKDDTMAESIANHLRLQPEYKVIHYQGDFHSKWRLGVVEKLQLLHPSIKIAVITPVYLEDFAELPGLLPQYQQAGDILVFVLKPNG